MRKVKHNIALSAVLSKQQEYNCQLLCFPSQLLIDWINTTLREEHIVVKSLEEDLYDGLVLHHLLGSLKLDVDKIALTEKKQRQKLSVILETVAKCLQLEKSQLKWSVESILTKDLVSTLHLLVAIAKHFEPNLAMPPNVQVETITIENTSRGLKTSNAVEYITENNRAPDKLDAVKKVLLQFVNQHVGKLGLNVKDISSQFADGVILLLLIGQLEGYFLNLRHFFLTPDSTVEMVGWELQISSLSRCKCPLRRSRVLSILKYFRYFQIVSSMSRDFSCGSLNSSENLETYCSWVIFS
uniref:Parvin gamma n=1 Tax=Strigops habroptila TaxID=2489341 RepID=A0A672TYD8_STRHB